MEHFDVAQWSDFVRQVGDRHERAEMDRHLASGCAECQALVATLGRVATVLRVDAENEPPQHVVRAVRALFALQGADPSRRLSRLPVRVTHDSAAVPVAAGTRNLRQTTRQLLYEAQQVAVDVRMDYQSDSQDLVVVGQVVRTGEAAGPLAQIPTFLLSQGEVVGGAITGRLGEFQLSARPSAALSLCLLVGETSCLELPLQPPSAK